MVRRFYPIILLILVLTFQFGCNSAPETRVENIRRQLLKGEFKQVYEQSANSLQSNSSKVDFIEKLDNLVERMKAADPDLNWRDNEFLEQIPGVKPEENSIIYISGKDVGSGEGKVVVVIFLEEENGEWKLARLMLNYPPRENRPYSLIP